MRGFMNGQRKEENEKGDENRGEVDVGRQAASVLELLGLLKGKRADGADQADEHQNEALDRHWRCPQQHRTGTREKRANENVNERAISKPMI